MIEQLARSLFNDIKSAIPTATSELPERELRSLLERTLRKMNLVSRDEFDAQQAVLLRTREKLEALEKQLSELESNGNTTKDSSEDKPGA
ncbi:accessory factor UbiK family protein [Aestuariicella sp. G3-2]|uniref:accessory factor UbiK family protein n=1 Tax=Pseudomaricurvus albidus TaxID=2842452 RepID=UPI001C0C5C5C|nr:accessory factor UbiK family protein [Aestuariicella albida]MBU3068534.1 accessory factor UbiK family protein [Aestuariicella albida]